MRFVFVREVAEPFIPFGIFVCIIRISKAICIQPVAEKAASFVTDTTDLETDCQIVLCAAEGNGAAALCQGGGRMEAFSWKCSDVLEKHLEKPQECTASECRL